MEAIKILSIITMSISVLTCILISVIIKFMGKEDYDLFLTYGIIFSIVLCIIFLIT